MSATQRRILEAFGVRGAPRTAPLRNLQGTRFAILHAEVSVSKPQLGVYDMRDVRNAVKGVSPVLTNPSRNANMICWSPTGRNMVLAGLKVPLPAPAPATAQPVPGQPFCLSHARPHAHSAHACLQTSCRHAHLPWRKCRSFGETLNERPSPAVHERAAGVL